VTTDPTDHDGTGGAGLTGAGTSYTPGTWFGIVGRRATVLLPPSEKGRAGAIWALVDDGAGFDEVLDALVSEGLRTLPGFVLVAETDDAVRVVVRGESVASFETADGRVEVEGSGAATWAERSLTGVTRMTVSLGEPGEEEVGGTPLPLVGGLVRVSGIQVPPPAPEPPAQPEAPSGPAGVVTPMTPAGGPPPGGAAEGGAAEGGAGSPGTPGSPAAADAPFVPSLSVVPPIPAAGVSGTEEHADVEDDADSAHEPVAEPEPESGTEAGIEPEEPRSVWGTPAVPEQEAPEVEEGYNTPDPLTDPMTDSFSFARPLVDDDAAGAEGVDGAADTEMMPSEPEPEAPAAGPSTPPPPPAFPPPGMPPAPPAPPAPSAPPVPPPPPSWGTPPAEPTDDHDGLTRAGAPMPDVNSRPGIPGQPAAPKVTAFPVARLEFSSGDRVDVDRVVLVGRAPEAGRFTQSDQPLLVTVPSPHQEISSTHCEIRPGTGVDHGAAVVTDLGSTNGTVLVQPGLGPEDLRPGVPVQLIPGAVIDLGDGLTIRVTHP